MQQQLIPEPTWPALGQAILEWLQNTSWELRIFVAGVILLGIYIRNRRARR